MQHSYFHSNRRSLLLSVATLVCAAGLYGCVSSSERQQANFQEDARTCASFGSQHGSPAYNECMLAQQRRRDVKELESLKRTHMTAETAKNAQIMADRARKQRCDRDPDRKECG